VHNWHRAGLISGENRVVEGDTAMLRDAGVEVEIYSRSNDETADFNPVQWAEMSFRPIVSASDARGLRKHIRRFKPDIVHIHNVVPLLSPWVVRTAHAAGVPVVHTVHNYLHVCVAASYFRDGHPCFDCKGRALPWPAVLHGCSPTTRLPGPVGDRLKSMVLGTSLAVHRGTWKLVDRFLPVGSAVARHLEEAGIDPRKITVRGNPVSDPGPPSPPGDAGALFAGRLAGEKGPHLLLAAWERSGLGERHRLTIAGGGPDEETIKRTARGMAGVELLGHVEHARALELMTEASFVVVPSLWDEPFGLAVVEAMARGRPVLVTNLGEPAEMVQPGTGWVAEPTVDGLAAGLREAFDAPLEDVGRGARRRYEERYSPPVALRNLLTVYAELLGNGDSGEWASAR
jgi:glycosyltransferase involved in cell wall biosynthesis